jgi:hypothetical protein
MAWTAASAGKTTGSPSGRRSREVGGAEGGLGDAPTHLHHVGVLRMAGGGRRRPETEKLAAGADGERGRRRRFRAPPDDSLQREVEDDDAHRLVAVAQRGGDGDVRAKTMNLQWRSVVLNHLLLVALQRKRGGSRWG